MITKLNNADAHAWSKSNRTVKYTVMSIKLSSKELSQIIGGTTDSDLTGGLEKRNTNKTEFCMCTYVNKSQISNVNKVYSCSCQCHYE